MFRTLPVIAASFLLALPTVARAEMSQEVAQAQQNRSQMDSEYQRRLGSARTPEERARIQAEYDRQMQQGALPGHDHSDTRVQTAPGTAESGALPHTPTPDHGPKAGESPGGGGSVPHGQGSD